MKNSCFFLLVLFTAFVSIYSCSKPKAVQYTITSDRLEIIDIPAQNPMEEKLEISTDAPYWIVQSPSWAVPDAITGVGNGASIVTFTISSNYKNEKTDVAPRSGEIKFSGGGTSLIVPITQQGYTAPIDPNASIGGITDIEEFKDFISAVNAGSAYTRWLNADGEVELLTDLNLASFESWVPIGMPDAVNNGNNNCSYEGAAFTGVFNGGGHTISNFTASDNLGDPSTLGFFGVLDRATVKNLIIKGTLNVSATGTADVGMLAGTVISSTIEDVKIEGTINSTGSTATKRFSLGGLAGFAFSISNEGESANTLIRNCEISCDVMAVGGSNLASGATAAQYGGVVGFSTNPKDDSRVTIENCKVSGNLNVTLGRCSGIVATANAGTIVKDCTNEANQINAIPNGRIGNVVSVLGVNCSIIDSINNGNLTTTGAQTTTGAIAGLLNDNTVIIKGGRNNGTIIGANASYLGLIAANFSKFSSVADFTVSGQIGLYKEDGKHDMYSLSEGTFMNHIGNISEANKAKLTNIVFAK